MKRFCLNISLLLLILLTMGYQFLPQLYHEVLGLVLLAGGVWHLLLNRQWFSGMFSGSWSKLRVMQTLLGILLVISFIVALGTGVIISNRIFRELWVGVELHRSIFVHQLHISSAYLMTILGGMHIGMHWTGLWNRLKKLSLLGFLDTRPTLSFWVLVIIGWTGCALSRLDHVGDRLIMKHIFGTMTSQFPAGVYYIMLLCMMGLYAIGFYHVQKYLQEQMKKRWMVK